MAAIAYWCRSGSVFVLPPEFLTHSQLIQDRIIDVGYHISNDLVIVLYIVLNEVSDSGSCEGEETSIF